MSSNTDQDPAAKSFFRDHRIEMEVFKFETVYNGRLYTVLRSDIMKHAPAESFFRRIIETDCGVDWNADKNAIVLSYKSNNYDTVFGYLREGTTKYEFRQSGEENQTIADDFEYFLLTLPQLWQLSHKLKLKVEERKKEFEEFLDALVMEIMRCILQVAANREVSFPDTIKLTIYTHAVDFTTPENSRLVHFSDEFAAFKPTMSSMLGGKVNCFNAVEGLRSRLHKLDMGDVKANADILYPTHTIVILIEIKLIREFPLLSY